MPLALATDLTITFGVLAFFALLALLTFLRLLLRKSPPTWRRLRLGVFVEREPDREREPEPPRK